MYNNKKPSYYEKYLLRGDRLFLNLLKTNKFSREVFFTDGFIEDFRLSLKDNLNSLILIDRINHNRQQNLTFEEYNSRLSSVLDCLNHLNTNSQQELNFVDNIRFDIFTWIYNSLKNGDKKQADKLIEIIDMKINPNDFPFQSDQTLKFYEYLKEQI